VIADSMKALGDAKVPKTFRRLFMNYPRYEELRQALDKYEEERANLLGEVRRDAKEAKLHADVLIGDLFNLASEIAVTPAILEAARQRFDLGNPPGKNRSYGDAVNWEALLTGVPNDHGLLFVTFLGALRGSGPSRCRDSDQHSDRPLSSRLSST
jgi:hypothetical protein